MNPQYLCFKKKREGRKRVKNEGMSKEKRHEPKGRDIKEKGNEKVSCLPLHTETEESRARPACGHSAMHVSWPYLLSKTPSLIVRPGLLDAAPQVRTLRVELPC